MQYTLTINGAARTVDVDDDTPLLWVLRDELKLTGTKYGCGIAQCGACTVMLDGSPVRSCQTPVAVIGDRPVTTIEGVEGAAAEALQAAWADLDVPQCGYCQSGQIMSAVALLTSTPEPTDEDINFAMQGNLCRCASYHRIRAGIKAAAAKLSAEG